MERNKWEEEFKNKLAQREIAPTPHAWERLDAMLNQAESNEGKAVPVRRLNWLYVAAGFAGFILIATLFFKSGKPENNNEPRVAGQEKPKVETGNNPMEIMPDTVKQTQVAVSAPNAKEEKVLPIKRQNIRRKSEPQKVQQEKQVQIAQVEEKTPGQEIPDIQLKTSQKINLNGVNVDEKIASLGPKIQSPKPVKVDPNSLLSQVDGELELTFREKVIKSVGKKYQNVKVALANRNNKE